MSAAADPILMTDITAARDHWTAMVGSGEVHEVRIPKTRKGRRRFWGRVSGYFDNVDDFTAALAGITGHDAQGIYLTLNPVNPDLLARASNRLKDRADETTSDPNVLCRTNILLDFDPRRPSGICATDAERDAALAVRDNVRAFLVEAMGWTAPAAILETGNGGGLIYRVSLPNDSESNLLVRQVLAGLAMTFDTPEVVIDTETANAARLVKIAGTVSAKGDNVADRPWRLATATYPPDVAPVPLDALSRVAALAPEPGPSASLSNPNGHQFEREWDIRDVLRQNGIDFKERIASYATVLVLDRCLTSDDHADAACVLEFPSGALAYTCRHASCAGRRWADVRPQLLGSGETNRRSGDRASSAADDVDSSNFSRSEDQEAAREPKQADRLIALTLGEGDVVELFHTSTCERYAKVPVGSHFETWALQASGFRDWLAYKYWDKYRSAPSAQAMQNALATLGGKASFEGDEHEVFVRLAWHQGGFYLDLGDADWRAVEITAQGWRLLESANVPVRFRRPKTLLPLPVPVSGGTLSDLEAFVNVKAEQDLILTQGWLIGVFQPSGGRAILEITGEQGTAKTSLARMLRRLVDPCTVPLRGLPRNERDLLIAAQNGLIIAIDNVSGIKDWCSDALCRLSTGGGVSGRQLYTDGDEYAIDAQRPALVTAINRVGQRGDLLDRTISITLSPIPSEKRRTEASLAEAFEAAHPKLLGTILDAVVRALANYRTLQISDPPRLADFVTWVEAAAPALGWKPGAFQKAFKATRQDADEAAVEALPVGPAIQSLMAHQDEWKGTASALLEALTSIATDEVWRDTDWPKRANGLSKQLRRLAPNLRRLGIRVEHERDGSERRIVLQKDLSTNRHGRHDRHQSSGNGYGNARSTDDDDEPANRHAASPGGHVSSSRKTNGFRESDDSDGRDDPAQHCSVLAAPVEAGITGSRCYDCGGPAPADGMHQCPACRGA